MSVGIPSFPSSPFAFSLTQGAGSGSATMGSKRKRGAESECETSGENTPPLQTIVIIQKIFSFLNSKETESAAWVCKFWRGVKGRYCISDDQIFRRLTTTPLNPSGGVTSASIVQFFTNAHAQFPLLRALHIRCLYGELASGPERMIDIVRALPLMKEWLHSLSIVNKIRQDSFNPLARQLRYGVLKIQSLRLPFPPVKGCVYQPVSLEGPITVPPIRGNFVHTLEFNLHGLLNRKGIRSIAHNFPALISLTIIKQKWVQHLGKLDLKALMECLPKLVSLRFEQVDLSFGETSNVFRPWAEENLDVSLETATIARYLNSIHPHPNLRELKFIECALDIRIKNVFVQKTPNLTALDRVRCTSIVPDIVAIGSNVLDLLRQHPELLTLS
jgi:hypothetical protein